MYQTPQAGQWLNTRTIHPRTLIDRERGSGPMALISRRAGGGSMLIGPLPRFCGGGTHGKRDYHQD